MIAMHMGDEDRLQVMQGQAGVQQPVLRGLAAVDQIPAAPGFLDQRKPGDIAPPGGRGGRGAEKENVQNKPRMAAGKRGDR